MIWLYAGTCHSQVPRLEGLPVPLASSDRKGGGVSEVQGQLTSATGSMPGPG